MEENGLGRRIKSARKEGKIWGWRETGEAKGRERRKGRDIDEEKEEGDKY